MPEKRPIDISEILHIANTNNSQPVEDKTHIKDFFEVTNLKHKTRLKRKDVKLLTIIESRYEHYKKKYGLDVKILKIICDEFRNNLVSLDGISRNEFVETIKNQPQFPVAENLTGLGNVQPHESVVKKAFKR